MSAQARIRYYLSEQGRLASLRQGGNCRRLQETVGVVDESDLAAFSINDEGLVSFDATVAFYPREVPVPAGTGRMVKTSTGEEELEWDVVPTWDDLVAIARQVKASLDKIRAYAEEDAKLLARIARDFLDHPGDRATTVDRDHVVIAARRFKNDQPVAAEARQRWALDQEELKKANRETLAGWIGQHGNENQRQRLAAGLLPWKEAHESLERHIFGPLSVFEPYTRFDPEKVCVCVERTVTTEICEVKFKSFDATELTADEWERYSAIRVAIPDAQFQLREHQAHCESLETPAIKRGVIVKRTVERLAFKREFAL